MKPKSIFCNLIQKNFSLKSKFLFSLKCPIRNPVTWNNCPHPIQHILSFSATKAATLVSDSHQALITCSSHRSAIATVHPSEPKNPYKPTSYYKEFN